MKDFYDVSSNDASLRRQSELQIVGKIKIVRFELTGLRIAAARIWL